MSLGGLVSLAAVCGVLASRKGQGAALDPLGSRPQTPLVWRCFAGRALMSALGATATDILADDRAYGLPIPGFLKNGLVDAGQDLSIGRMPSSIERLQQTLLDPERKPGGVEQLKSVSMVAQAIQSMERHGVELP